MNARQVENGGEIALETEEISKRFGAVRAVDELSISIPRRGMTSIVGPNGSGKSTLVNLLSGTLPLDGGMVIIDGTGLRVVHAHETPEHGLTPHVPGGAAVRPDKRAGQHHSCSDQNGGSFRRCLNAQGPEHRERARDDPGECWNVGKARFAGDGAFVRTAEAARDRARNGDGRQHVFVRRAVSPVCSRRCWRGSRTS